MQYYHFLIFANFKIIYMLILKWRMIIVFTHIFSILGDAEHFLGILSLFCDFSVDVFRPISLGRWEGTAVIKFS